LGDVFVVGVCIPWRSAHVFNGRRDRVPWQDHRSYLKALAVYLKSLPGDLPTVIVGDFNQRIPRRYAPAQSYEALMSCLDGYNVCSAGSVPGLSIAPVCHIAHSEHLKAERVEGMPRKVGALTLSDHDGILAQLCV
jgi:endonuclease/exonuclease/phosphatase family metal-dependent hydrolase